MAATYKQFLASPSSSLLADKVSLHYVTTTISVSGPAEIIKHLNTVQKQVKKKKQDILNAVDGQVSAAFEVDTTLEFLISGGPYLPGLDDNFITDRVVYLPVTHFVSFAEDGKISQIRLSWDQGSLLKQVEVIGKTGRNWPIKDSQEQISLIQSSLKSGGAGPATSAQNHKEVLNRTRGSSTNALRDPHATLHMQPTREEIEGIESSAVVSPYGGSRPKQRGFTDILGDNPEGSHYEDRHAMSPVKIGGGKNFQPMRIFEGQEEQAAEDDAPKGRPVSQYIKPNPRKYNHFDFADGSDPNDAPSAGISLDERPKSKHDSQWSFDDFVTPSKPTSKPLRAQEVRHWDTDKEALGDQTPAQAPGKGRRDAETHFELQDDGERVSRPDRGHQKGAMHNEGLGLYKNKLFDQEDAQADPAAQRPLGNITNLKDRGKDFDAHWLMTDESPAHAQAERPQPVPEARKKAVKMMDANWSSYDESPKQKENTRTGEDPSDTRIHIAGDGMGGKKGTNRNWLYGGDDEELPKPTAPKRSTLTSQQRSFWEF